jgi:hypothetical protein
MASAEEKLKDESGDRHLVLIILSGYMTWPRMGTQQAACEHKEHRTELKYTGLRTLRGHDDNKSKKQREETKRSRIPKSVQ